MNAPTPPQHWCQLTSEVACRAANTDHALGLSDQVAATRLASVGPNEIEEQGRRSLWQMYLDQFRDFMILVLMAAAMVSGIVGEPLDAIAIVVIVLLNAIIGVIQEYRAERAIQALRRLAAPFTRTLRGGRIKNIPAAQLVPRDIVLVKAGDLLSADVRVLEAFELKVDEAALTGESESIVKDTDALPEQDLSLGDRSNMAYKGTLVTNGRGKGVVIGTGMATEIGRIAALLSRQETEKNPLQKRLAGFGQRLAMSVLVICLVIFGGRAAARRAPGVDVPDGRQPGSSGHSRSVASSGNHFPGAGNA